MGDEAFLPALLKDMEAAESSIFCAIYMFKTDGERTEPTGLILSAMIYALSKGVSVDLLLDIDSSDSYSTKINSETGAVLARAGANIYYDSPDRRLHTKMCVIDGYISYIGSHNYTYSAMKRNGEASVRIISPEVASEAISYIRSYTDEAAPISILD